MFLRAIIKDVFVYILKLEQVSLEREVFAVNWYLPLFKLKLSFWKYLAKLAALFSFVRTSHRYCSLASRSV